MQNTDLAKKSDLISNLSTKIYKQLKINVMRQKFIIPLLILGISIGACQKPDDGPESGTQTPESGTQTPEGGSQNPEGGETTPAYTIDIPSSEDTSPVLGTEGGSVVLNFSTSAEWTANVINTRADSWIDVSPKNGNAGEAKITITVEPNDTYDERSATVQIKCGSAEKNIVVTQKQKDALTLTTSNFEVSAEGETIQIEVKSNVSVKVSLQAGIDWVRETKSRAMSTNTYYFTIDANNSFESREATITFEDEKSDLKDYVTIIQKGDALLTVHVPTKGGLQTTLAGKDLDAIKNLKITGILNDVDFVFIISRLPNLKALDISEVEISILPSNAFANSTNVENIILPNTLTEIGEEIFLGSKLKFITIPQNVRNIGPRAFSLCRSLTSVTIPASVETIGELAFSSCSKLKVVTFEKGSNLKMINDKAFAGCPLISIEIPSSVESIGEEVFRQCSDLESVVFEEGSRLTLINDGAFYICGSLGSIRIPNSVEKIGESAFWGCSGLETVIFENGSKLKEIGDRSSYAHGAFHGCSSLVSIEIPANVELIGDETFQRCSKLEVVSFEKNSHLKLIGTYAFSYCKFTSIEIPASVETIEARAFSMCSQLTTVSFEKGSKLNTIPGMYATNVSYAFSGSENLVTIDMSECAYVESIGSYAFNKNKNLRLFLIGTKTPPKCSSNTFNEISSYSVLKVPSGCVDAYKAATGWKNFSSIIALDE